MKYHPTFSVIIANYNNDRYIEAAINSVFNQSYGNWELVIVDDASTDDSLSIINPYLKDERVHLIKHEKHLGCGAAKRTAAIHSSGEILGELDADDLLDRMAIEIMVREHKSNPGIGLIYSTHYNFVDSTLNCKKALWVGVAENGGTHLAAPKVSQFRTFKKSAYKKTDGFSAQLKAAVDRDLVYKLEEVTDFKFIDECLYYRRVHENGISQFKQARSADFYDTIARHEAYLRRLRNGCANISRAQINNRLKNSFIESIRANDLEWSRIFLIRLLYKNTFSVKHLLLIVMSSGRFACKRLFGACFFWLRFFGAPKEIPGKSIRFLYANMRKYYHNRCFRMFIDLLVRFVFIFWRRDLTVKLRLKYVVVGCPRSGTGYLSRLLEEAGVKCGHEDVFSIFSFDCLFYGLAKPAYEADSSFLAAPYLGIYKNTNTKIIHITRHPLKVISSLMNLDFFSQERDATYKHHQLFVMHIYTNLPNLQSYKHQIDKCAYFYLEWNNLIEQNKTSLDITRFKLEDIAESPNNFLGQIDDELVITKSTDLKEAFNTKSHEKKHNKQYSLNDIKDPKLHRQLSDLLKIYDYE